VTDIFEEVEEDYRRERYQLLAKRYGPYAVAAIVGLVLLIAGLEAMKSYRAHQMEERAKAFASAQAELARDPRAAAQAFGALGSKGGGYGLLARFREAAALEAAGDTGGAVKVLDQLRADASKQDQQLADLALLKTGYLLLDRQTRADIETRLTPILAPGNPWRGEAREILAFAALKSGEQAKAVEIFNEIAHSADNPESLRNRAASMLMALNATPAAPATPPATAPGAKSGGGSGAPTPDHSQ
jgi:hypothetical protein